jgi:hypothetical protein
MAIAPNRTSDELLADARQIAADGASWLDRAAALQRYVAGIGPDGLNSAGFATDDAAEYVTLVGYMAQLAAIAEGLQDLPAAFNFANALAVLAGPPLSNGNSQ